MTTEKTYPALTIEIMEGSRKMSLPFFASPNAFMVNS
jgi:hypothetical protein